MKNKSGILVILSLMTLSGIIACSKQGSQNADAPDELTLIAPMPLDKTAKETELSKAARDGRPFSREVILNAVENVQASAYVDSFPESERTERTVWMNQLKPALHRTVRVAAAHSQSGAPQKEDLDFALEKRHGKKLAYDPSLDTIFHVIGHDGLQCDSGSVLFLYTQISGMTGPEYQAQNPVLLVEKGHYLPGFAVPEEDGRYRLVGVEMTSSSNSYIDYGSTNELEHNDRVNERGLRVLDAVSFLAMEALGSQMSEEQYEGFRKTVLKKTALKYGIHLQALEEIVDKFVSLRPALEHEPRRKRPATFSEPEKLQRLEVRPEGTGYAKPSAIPGLHKKASEGKAAKVSQGVSFAREPRAVFGYSALDGLQEDGFLPDLQLAGDYYLTRYDHDLALVSVTLSGELINRSNVYPSSLWDSKTSRAYMLRARDGRIHFYILTGGAILKDEEVWEDGFAQGQRPALNIGNSSRMMPAYFSHKSAPAKKPKPEAKIDDSISVDKPINKADDITTNAPPEMLPE
jgi:hypothetical protein